MKSERRHELESNSLAMWFSIRAPELWQKYGNHILVGLIIVVVGIYIIRWRLNAPVVARAQAVETLAGVAEKLRMGRSVEDASIPQSISEALAETQDKNVRMLAYVLQGEYHWNLANPQISESGRITSNEDSYQSAKEAFELALGTGGDQQDLFARAHSGLAMIAEEQAFEKLRASKTGESKEADELFDTAKKEYQIVIDAKNTPPGVASALKSKLKTLDEMRKPVWIAKAPSTRPTTLPALNLDPSLWPLSPSLLPGSPGLSTPAGSGVGTGGTGGAGSAFDFSKIPSTQPSTESPSAP